MSISICVNNPTSRLQSRDVTPFLTIPCCEKGGKVWEGDFQSSLVYMG